MVGVPYFFEWDSVEQVNLEQIRHKWKYPIVTRFTNHSLTLENLELSCDELNELKETFVLSSNAKKFAIAQSVLYLIYGSHMDEVDRVVDAKLQILGRDY